MFCDNCRRAERNFERSRMHIEMLIKSITRVTFAKVESEMAYESLKEVRLAVLNSGILSEPLDDL